MNSVKHNSGTNFEQESNKKIKKTTQEYCNQIIFQSIQVN